MPSHTRFTTFPKTQPPPEFVPQIVAAFILNEAKVATPGLTKGLESNQVIRTVGPELLRLGFQVEIEKTRKIPRPVFFGEMGEPGLKYEIDGYHPAWRCGIEIEAGRALGGNAIFRDLFQAMVMTDVDHLVLAVPLVYRRKSGGKMTNYADYKKTLDVADALYGHDRIKMPYGLTVIGY